MDEFFKNLREIQKKERANSSLARVGSDFYKRTHKYIDDLKKKVDSDPFSNEYYLLNDIQRITTEICERREHKITDAAVMNIQRSYRLFKGKPKFDLLDTTPSNITNEEEKLYFSLIDTLKDHRQSILDKFTENIKKSQKTIKKEHVNNRVKKEPIIDKSNNLTNPNIIDKNNSSDVLKKLKKIKKAKVIEEKSSKNIIKQINKPTTSIERNNIDLNSILGNEDDQFIDLDNYNRSNDTNSSNKLDNNINETILIFSKIDAIVGIDEKIYGPFYPQDIVVMPNENAKVITKNRKGRLIKF